MNRAAKRWILTLRCEGLWRHSLGFGYDGRFCIRVAAKSHAFEGAQRGGGVDMR